MEKKNIKGVKKVKIDKILKKTEDFKINEIDILILLVTTGRKLSITEIRDAIGIAYKNIRPHLDRLEKYNLLKIKDRGKGRAKEIAANIEDNKAGFLIVSLFNLLGLVDLDSNGLPNPI